MPESAALGLALAHPERIGDRYRGEPWIQGESTGDPNSPVHEERHLALLILVLQSAKGGEAHRKRAFDLFMGNTRSVNNWDLVDCSAPQVVGGFLLDKSKKPLFKLAKSTSLWERRIAIVSTQHFIRWCRLPGCIGTAH